MMSASYNEARVLMLKKKETAERLLEGISQIDCKMLGYLLHASIAAQRDQDSLRLTAQVFGVCHFLPITRETEKLVRSSRRALVEAAEGSFSEFQSAFNAVQLEIKPYVEKEESEPSDLARMIPLVAQEYAFAAIILDLSPISCAVPWLN